MLVVVYRCLMLVEKKTNSKQMPDPNGNSGEELGHKKPSTRNPIGDERLAFKLSGCARGSFWGVCWVVRSIEIDRETDEIRCDRASRPAMRGARLSSRPREATLERSSTLTQAAVREARLSSRRGATLNTTCTIISARSPLARSGQLVWASSLDGPVGIGEA